MEVHEVNELVRVVDMLLNEFIIDNQIPLWSIKRGFRQYFRMENVYTNTECFACLFCYFALFVNIAEFPVLAIIKA